jgi:hypothetical protein
MSMAREDASGWRSSTPAVCPRLRMPCSAQLRVPVRPGSLRGIIKMSCMLFGLQEVALPSISEAKRAWTLIQLLIRPRGRRRTPPVVKPLKPQLGHTFAGGLEA